ncbi:MAG: hypothetical protein ACI4Q3_03625 [Kiritimatiellia bacterium]
MVESRLGRLASWGRRGRLSPLALVSAFAATAVAAPVTLVAPGDFSPAQGVTFEESSAGREMVIAKPGGRCAWTFRLDPKWAVVNLKGEMRVTDVPRAQENWKTGRFAMEWKDAKGKTVCPWPNNAGLVGTSGWVRYDYDNFIPTNAAYLAISLCNLASGGEVRFRNVSLTIRRDRMDRPGNAPLPEGAPADAESLAGAWKVETPTRARYSMNGIWRIRPALAGDADGAVPGADDNWAWDRIPAVWPGSGAFAASRHLSPWFEDHPEMRADILPDRAWYARTLTIPPEAAGRRAFLSFDMIASRATVYVDGRRAGAVEFPNGEVEITGLVKPGERQTLALDVTAYAQGDTWNYNEATRADRERKIVKFKGVTGDLWLDLAPKAARIVDAFAETSVERGEITFCAELEGGAKPCRMVAEVEGCGETRRFEGEGRPRPDGTVAFTAPWADAKLWDTHTPGNRYVCRLSADGDTFVPFSFGFREVKIRGRDLYLNGTRLHLRALWDGSSISPGDAGAKENMLALYRTHLANGFNFVIAGNYSFNAGAVTYLKGILEACDETGMLYSFTLPHFKDFAPVDKPEMSARYRRVARGLVRLVRNHPAVVTYALNHNAAGYLGAGNPRRIDGKYELPLGKPNPSNPWDAASNRPRARIVRRIVRELDATRPAYHHESGNLDDFHTVNCYLNWAPIQERSEWLEHWATEGVKPLFFVEWGLPHVSSWSSYRGPLFIWRCQGYMSLWNAEFAAALRGDVAYENSPEAHAALRREEELWARGEPFQWGHLHGAGQAVSNNYWGVQATMAADNWRSFRGWGITAMLPWDQGGLFRRVRTSECAVDWNEWAVDAKRPGLVARPRVAWGDPRDWEPTALGQVFRRWNLPDCAWIGGGENFTDKRHIFRPGESIQKTLVIVNDRRVDQTVGWRVACGGFTRAGDVRIAAGDQARVPLTFRIDEAGTHRLRAVFSFAGGVVQEDAFDLTVLAPVASPKAKLAVYDPKGLTAANLKRLALDFDLVADLAGAADGGRVVVVGREALTPELYRRQVLPCATRGGRVILFEQGKDVLEAIGFRVQTYGMRRGFPRYRSEALRASQREDLLRDWAGASTLVPGQTPNTAVETSAARDTWAGWTHARPWRNGNRGAIATVIPEKPALGDWRALVDGAFDLQYAPLLEWRTRGGRILFCQLDVTARTVCDPAADDLVRRLVDDVRGGNPGTRAAYPCGMQAYASALARGEWTIEHDRAKTATTLYYVTGGGAKRPDDFFDRIRDGATALLCGLTADEVKAWSPVPLACAEVKGAYPTRIREQPPELNGLSNGDWSWHGGIDFAAFTDDVPDGNAAFRVVRHGKGRLVFWQVPPWKIDDVNRPYLRISKRRAEAMLSRLMGNLGFNLPPVPHFYADVPVETDDPYRYFHW